MLYILVLAKEPFRNISRPTSQGLLFIQMGAHMRMYTGILTRSMVCDHGLNTHGKVASGHAQWCGQCNLWKMDRISKWRLDCCEHSRLSECCTAASRISALHCCHKHVLFALLLCWGATWAQHQHGVVAFPWFSVPYVGCREPEANFASPLGRQWWGLWIGLLTFTKPKPFGVGACPHNIFYHRQVITHNIKVICIGGKLGEYAWA